MAQSPSAASPPVEPALAVSVILLRRRDGLLEVFIQNRALTMDFAAGAVVFPGGRVDEVDQANVRLHPLPVDMGKRHARAWQDSRIAEQGKQEAARWSSILLAAAKREVFEETGAVLEVADLLPWANWVTPPDSPKRFDTYFYLARPSPDLQPAHLTTEAESSHWAPAADLLQAADESRITLMVPTRTLLTELSSLGELGDIEAVFDEERRIVPVGFVSAGRRGARRSAR